MRKAREFIILGLLVLLQTQLLPWWPGTGRSPDLIMLGISMLALMVTPMNAILNALLTGLMYDLMVGHPMGLMILTYALCGYAPVAYTRLRPNMRWFEVIALIAMITALKEGILMGYCYFTAVYIELSFITILLRRLALNCLLALPLYFLFSLIIGYGDRRHA